MLILHNAEIVLRHFLLMETYRIFGLFGTLPNAVRGDKFVYVPGTRDWTKRALIVAHADTVRNKPLEAWALGYNRSSATFFTTDQDCLGADDRAGVAAAWLLAASGHSVLICDEEEIGCIGATSAVNSIIGELECHAFAVEIDRAGSEEMVFYSGTSNADFKEWLSKQFVGWKQGWGSFTDISEICPSANICGVNLAAGYRNQHSNREYLSVEAWLETMEQLKAVLELEEYPKFGAPVARVLYSSKYTNGQKGSSKKWWHKGSEWWENNEPEPEQKLIGSGDVAGDIIGFEADDDYELPVINNAGDVLARVAPEVLKAQLDIEDFEEALDNGFVWAEDLMGKEAETQLN